jgi:TAT (twin-arginine translocation) pathway signal sequence
MSDHSRRTFLRGAGVSAAAVGIAAVLPAGIASASTTKESDTGAPATTKPVVAYVTDPSAGTITVLHGEKETVITDKSLARKIAKLAP